MNHLKSITDRLHNPLAGKMELSKRKVFINRVKTLAANKGIALSVGVGDGIWDYLIFRNSNIHSIIATDVIACPVSRPDQALLKQLGDWKFLQIGPEAGLPFDDCSFDIIFHQDVIEHTEKPYLFLQEQHRVLKNGGTIICGTPNLFRPANIAKLLTGTLKFPINIGFKIEIGDYIHIQEFYEQQLRILVKEAGFEHISVYHCFWGLPFAKVCFSMYPKGNIGKSLCHFLIVMAKKDEKP